MSSPENNRQDRDDIPPGATLREHVYDGIEEYDQRLPNWWLWTLYIAIIISGLYWIIWYTFRAVPSDAERVTAAMQEIEARRFAMVGDLDDETLWAMSRNPNVIASGQAVYRDQCAFCHGDDLGGGLGGGLPLDDGVWKWGHAPIDIYSIVRDGSPDAASGMQAFERELGPRRVAEVVAYILSYHDPENMETAPDSPGRASER